jgi:hypothetical protein
MNAEQQEFQIGVGTGRERKYSVGDVWRSLPRVEAWRECEPAPKQNSADVNLDGVLRPKDGTIRFESEDGRNVRFSQAELTDLRSWRCFARASQMVAEVEERRSGKKVLSFDLSMTTPDSLACLWFEIWASEIHRSITFWKGEVAKSAYPIRVQAWVDEAAQRLQWFSADRYDPNCPDLSSWLKPFARDDQPNRVPVRALDRFQTLYRPGIKENERVIEILDPYHFPGFTLELYLAWLLLIEMLPMEQLFDREAPFQLRSDRALAGDAAAVRHWYKSACTASQLDECVPAGERVIKTQVPVRLPGNFSVRGDWYLAVAQGSRSSRLADLGLDMLTSRRANRTRLYLGLGLPTRDLAEGEQARYLRTRLSVSSPDTVSYVLYDHLASLGARNYLKPPNEGMVLPTDNEFRWFFRTAFKDYDRQAATFRKWMGRVFAWTIQFRHEQRREWEGGFKAYDELTNRRPEDLKSVLRYPSVRYIAKFIDLLVMDLDQCRLKPPS